MFLKTVFSFSSRSVGGLRLYFGKGIAIAPSMIAYNPVSPASYGLVSKDGVEGTFESSGGFTCPAMASTSCESFA